jgi:anti-sigma B factor antagonist
VGFKLSLHKLDGNIPKIMIDGEIDALNAPELKQMLLSLLESGEKEVLLDLTNIDYLDSGALGVLIGGLKRMREKDANMSVVCPTPRIRRIFEFTGLDKIFSIFNSQEEALASIGRETE